MIKVAPNYKFIRCASIIIYCVHERSSTMLTLLTFTYLTFLQANCRSNNIAPEVDWTLEQRISNHGYPVQTHRVLTEDGYILTLYHIPNSKQENKNSPVLLLHGMGGCPHNFVVLGAHRSAPYYFYDRGYDVWLFSSRGSEGAFSERHVNYDWNKDKEYWQFSLHEIAIYDIPACIDYISNYTSKAKVALIGHSAAGNEFFAMFSEIPEYNDKVTVAIAWASAPILKRTDYPIAIFSATLVDLWKGLSNMFELEEFLPFTRYFKPLVRVMCADPEWQQACILATAMGGSHKSAIQHPKDIQVIASNLPRLSSRQIYHFMDNFNNGTFRKYDYGPKQNLKIYGQVYPPHYNFSAATAPTAFFLGPWDNIIQLKDIHEVALQVPNTIKIYEIPFEKFTHTDFIFGRNATELLYEPTFQLVRDIDNGVVFSPIKPPFVNQ